MVQIIQSSRPTFSEQLGQNLGSGISEGFMQARQAKQLQGQMEQENKALKALGVDLSGITDPKVRQTIIAETMKKMTKEDTLAKKQSFLENLIGGNQQETKSTQNVSEGLEPELQREGKGRFNPADITDEQILLATNIDPSLGKELREAKNAIKKEEVSQRKETRESFSGENGKYISKTHDQYEDSRRKESIFERMEQLENSGELSDSGTINLLEQIGFAPEWLKNPANEEYNKLALDLLGGGTLQADYGSRVLASEFKISQQRIPSLIQTAEGRRQIRENLETMLLPAKLKEERLQYYIDKSERTGESLPHDLRGRILKDIKPQLEEAYDKFKQRNGRYKVKEGTIPDDDSIEKYFFISDGNPDKAKKMMKEDGYDIR